MTDTQRAERLKRTVMILLMLSMVPFLFGSCAGLAARGRMDQFSRIAKKYEWALESRNYRGAAEYLDPSIARPSIDFGRYDNIKVSQYTITRAKVSDDQRSIEQDVELHYFLLDKNVVRTTMDHQVWRYLETKGAWMLQTGLPMFPQ